MNSLTLNLLNFSNSLDYVKILFNFFEKYSFVNQKIKHIFDSLVPLLMNAFLDSRTISNNLWDQGSGCHRADTKSIIYLNRITLSRKRIKKKGVIYYKLYKIQLMHLVADLSKLAQAQKTTFLNVKIFFYGVKNAEPRHGTPEMKIQKTS